MWLAGWWGSSERMSESLAGADSCFLVSVADIFGFEDVFF